MPCSAMPVSESYTAKAYIKRHDFLTWARRQGCDDATIDELIRMLREAPPIARDWMDPAAWGTEEATFVNRHVLLRGALD